MTIWRKSSFCADRQCVEVARDGGEILVRNSGDPTRVLRFDRDAWQAFLESVGEVGVEG